MRDDSLRIDRFFTRRMFIRQYIPALISAVVLSFGDVADSLVLGHRIGYVGLAALALTMPVAQVFNVIMNALGIGGSVRFASRMARGKREEAVAGFQGVVCAAGAAGLGIALAGNLLLAQLLDLLGAPASEAGIHAAAGEYLRILLWGAPVLFLNYVLNYFLKTDDLEKEAGIAFTAGNILDIGLNIVLVLVLRMGVTGAGLATVAGQALSLTFSAAVIRRRGSALKLRGMKPDLEEAWKSFRVGLSSSVEFLYSMVFLLIANHLLIGTQGGAGAAMLDVVLGASYFMMNLYDAVVKSILPVVSTYSGERNAAGMRLALKTGLRYTLCSGAALGFLVFAFPEAICRFFGMDDPALTALGRNALRLYALSIPPAGIGILMANYWEARQMERRTLAVSTLRGGLPILLALLLASFRPEGFWSLYLLSELLTLAGIAVLFRPRRSSDENERRVFRSTILSVDTEISRTVERIEEFCERWNATPSQQYMAMMSVEEICVATLNSGFQGKADGFIQIVLIALEEGGFELHIRDNAASFNPLALEMKENPDAEGANLDALGIVAIRRKTKSFSYRHFQGFNTVIIRI